MGNPRAGRKLVVTGDTSVRDDQRRGPRGAVPRPRRNASSRGDGARYGDRSLDRAGRGGALRTRRSECSRSSTSPSRYSVGAVLDEARGVPEHDRAARLRPDRGPVPRARRTGWSGRSEATPRGAGGAGPRGLNGSCQPLIVSAIAGAWSSWRKCLAGRMRACLFTASSRTCVSPSAGIALRPDDPGASRPRQPADVEALLLRGASNPDDPLKSPTAVVPVKQRDVRPPRGRGSRSDPRFPA